LLEIPRERGGLKAKILEANYDTKLEFIEGRGGRQNKKTFCRGKMDIFWN